MTVMMPLMTTTNSQHHHLAQLHSNNSPFVLLPPNYNNHHQQDQNNPAAVVGCYFMDHNTNNGGHGSSSSSSSSSSSIKSKIMAHPHYHRLLAAYINCQKVKFKYILVNIHTSLLYSVPQGLVLQPIYLPFFSFQKMMVFLDLRVLICFEMRKLSRLGRHRRWWGGWKKHASRRRR